MGNGYHNYRTRIDKIYKKYADSTAISCLNDDGSMTKLSFSKLHERIRDFKKVMDRIGLKAGDRMILIDSHLPSAFCTMISATYWDVAVAPIDPNLPDTELNRFIEQLDPRVVFTDQPMVSRLADEVRRKYPVLNVRDEECAYPDISGYEAHELLPVTPDPDPEVCAIIMSSGTTGSMKPVLITYDAMVHCVKTNQHLLGLRHAVKCLLVFPLSHVSGLEASLCVSLCGGELQMVETFTSAVLQPALMAYQPTFFGMVPKVFDIMLQKMEQKIESMGAAAVWYYRTARKISAWFQIHYGIRQVGKVLLKPFSKALFGKNIELLFTGSAPVNENTAAAFMDLGLIWANMYASTECSVPITSTDRFDRYKPGTAGNVNHNSGIEIKINKPDAEGIGEIYVKTVQATKGYFREPALTAEAFDEGYFRTGDLGYIDKEGYLHITGRAKESILLHTGKKVAPTDLEEILAPICDEDNLVAVVGVPVKDKGYDEIHAFFESRGFSNEKKEQLKQKLLEYAKRKAPLYPITDVHFMDQIPKTSVFKVKRYILKDYVLNGIREISEKQAETMKALAETAASVINELPKESMEEQIKDIIRRCGKLKTEIFENSRLSEDLGLDSLTIFEVSSAIEEKYGVAIGDSLSKLPTVGDIIKHVTGGKKEGSSAAAAHIDKTDKTVGEFPKERGTIHKAVFRLINALAKGLYQIEEEGLENLPDSGAYILCPNHQSNLDGLWVMASMGKKAPKLDKLACMAKKELLDKKAAGFILTMMGGIPVDRHGNAAPAMRRSREWLKHGGCMLIHPEGTRTRDGKLLPFKAGAAQLAMDAGVPIIPVTIKGAHEIYAPGKLLPDFRTKDGKKPVLHMTFGKPVCPGEQSPDEMMAQVREEVSAHL